MSKRAKTVFQSSRNTQSRVLRGALAIAFGMVWGLTPTAVALDWDDADPTKSSVAGDGILSATSAHDGSYVSFIGNQVSGGGSENRITVEDDAGPNGGITGNVYGGLVVTGNDDASTNKVTISTTILGTGAVGTGFVGTEVAPGSVFGGYVHAGTGDVVGNTVTLNGGAQIGDSSSTNGGIYGGYVDEGTEDHLITGNKIFINDSVIANRKITGAMSATTVTGEITMTGNQVNLNIGADEDFEYDANGATDISGAILAGGDEDGSTLASNSVTIVIDEDATVTLGGTTDLYGAQSELDLTGADITGNFVSLNDSSGAATFGYVAGVVLHGETEADVSGNYVKIVDGKISGAVAGAVGADVGNSSLFSENYVAITDGYIDGNVFGATTQGTGDVTDNYVTIADGEITGSGNVYGAQANTGVAISNTVTITGGTIDGYVVGAWTNSAADGDEEDTAAAYGNSVSIGNASVDGMGVAGAVAGNGSAINNSVYLSDGADIDSVAGGVSFGGDANDNYVELGEGATVTGTVYGGFSGGGDALNNEINVTGKVDFDGTGSLVGGMGGGDVSGNVLNTHATGMDLDSISDFDEYNFFANSDFIGETVYTTDQTVDLSDSTVNTNLGAGMSFDDTKQINLFDNATIDDDTTIFQFNGGEGLGIGDWGTVTDGLFTDADMSYVYDNVTGELSIETQNARANSNSYSLGQAQLAGLQMTNIASDFARDIEKLYSVAAHQHDECYDPCGTRFGSSSPVLFAGVKGGTAKWNTKGGTKTDLNFVSLVAGLGWRWNGLLLAGYFESGWGSYDAKLGNGRKFVDGEKSDYIGGGFMARYEQNNFYGQAGFHAGRVKTDYKANFDGGYRGTHEMSSGYFGVDVVAGYRLPLGCSLLDLSASYTWNRSNGDNAVMRAVDGNVGNDIRVDEGSVNSHRVRVGGEWSYNGWGNFSPYAGAYYEHEFDAKSDVRYTDVAGKWYKGREASMKGSTGIGELGVRFASDSSRFSADIGVEGYVGKRRGVAGKALFGVSF